MIKANETFSLEGAAHAVAKLFTKHTPTVRIDICAEKKSVDKEIKKAETKEVKKTATAKSHDGSTLKVEDLVLCKILRMLRKKGDNPWFKPHRVTRVQGKKTCVLRSGLKGRPAHRHVDNLKSCDPGDAVIEDCKLNDGVIEEAGDIIGDMEPADIGCQNLRCSADDNWKDKVIYIGCPGIKDPPKMKSKKWNSRLSTWQCRLRLRTTVSRVKQDQDSYLVCS